jgi:pimeloyl-ACP methyl ester carboxylesterase
VALILALAGFALAPQVSAAAPQYAPVDQPGPPLSTPPSQLEASLSCESSVRNAAVEPVLLSPGTGSTPTENFGWNWEPALDQLGIPWCAFTPPYYTLGDIATSGEYLVNAIRTMYAMAHRPIAVIGHSQGGMSMRWALRFWPDTRAMVADVIGLSPSNHGTTAASASSCAPGCPPGIWQQIYGSQFVEALNSYDETFSGIAYTNIYTQHDEVVTPNYSASQCSSCLHTGEGQIANVATQDVCPLDLSDHIAVGTIDATAYALAVDALTHPGPAQPSRIPASTCLQLLMPGVLSPASVPAALTALTQSPPELGVATAAVGAGWIASALSGAPDLHSEPALPCYVFATCSTAAAPTASAPPTATAPTLRLTFHKGRLTRAGKRVVHIHVSVLEGSNLDPVGGVTITLAGHTAHTNRQGNATLTVRLAKKRTYRITASRQGCNPAKRTIRGR